MPVTVSHNLSATTPDDPGYEIRPSHWNDTHAVTINAAGSEISGAFGNGGGVTFGLSADGKITASAPAAGGGLTNINISAGTTSNNLSAITFSNLNGITFGLNASTLTASHNGLTTAMASNRGSDFVQATAAFAGTNASGTIASNGISVSVGNYITTARASTDAIGLNTAQSNVTWTVNSNGLSLDARGYAGTATGATNASVTANSNGISVSVGNYLTTARASTDAVGLNTALTAGPLAWTVNSNGISLNAGSAAGTSTGFTGGASISGSMTHNTAGLAVSLAHPAWITTAMASNRGSDFVQATAGFAGTNASGTIASNGISVSVGNYITTARASNDAVGLNTAQSNVTWTVNSGGISLDARGYAGTGTGLNVTNVSATLSANSNGVSLSLNNLDDHFSAWSLVGNTAGTTSSSLSTEAALVFSGGPNITLSGNSNTIVVSAAAGGTVNQTGPNIGVSNIGNTLGSTGTVSTGNVVLVGGNGVTLSQSTGAAGSNATITISAQTQATISSWSPPWAISGMATNSSLGQSTMYFMPVDIPDYLYASRINFYVSMSGALSAGNSTGTCSAGIGYALYTLNSVSLSRLTSYSAQIHSMSMNSNTQFAATHYFGISDVTSHSTLQTAISNANASTYLATNMNGLRVIALPVNSTLTPGRYWLGMSVQTVAGNAMTNNLSVAHTSVGVQPHINAMGTSSGASNASVFRMMQGLGSYSAQSGAWPNTIAYTTDAIRAPVAQSLIHFQIVGASYTTNYL